MKYIIVSILAMMAFRVAAQNVVEVNHSGSLMEIMHEEKLGSNISLDDLAKKQIYGLGALDSLRGEFIIEDGNVFVGMVKNGKESVFEGDGARAVLSVYAEVAEWNEVNFSGTDLEDGLMKIAEQNELLEPFPFLLKGSFKNLDYHIINFDPSKDQLSNHKKNAYKSNLAKKEVSILGFYSSKHKGVFTHHDSKVHMHVICQKRKRMGHVDNLDLSYGSFTLLIPQS